MNLLNLTFCFNNAGFNLSFNLIPFMTNSYFAFWDVVLFRSFE